MAETIRVHRPVENTIPINSGFGITRTIKTPDGVQTHVHHGIDFKAPIGTAIYAMMDGDIFRVGWENEFNHNQGLGFRIWQTFEYEARKIYGWYGHTSKILVKEGQKIKAGELIGFTGMNGAADGPHLHVQFREVNTGVWLNASFIQLGAAT